MSGTRITKQKIDKLMRRAKKRRKVQTSKTAAESATQSESKETVDKFNSGNISVPSDRIDEVGTRQESCMNGIGDVSSEVKIYRRNMTTDNDSFDVSRSESCGIGVDDVEFQIVDERCGLDVPKYSTVFEREIDNALPVGEDIAVNISNHKDPGDSTIELDHVELREENEKSMETGINADNLLGCLLTCGSQRISAVMYNVVRSVMGGRECTVCGASVKGAKLPGLTYLKTNLKPKIKSNILPRHEIIEVDVDCNRAGAKMGIGKYKSDSKAPLTFVRPSEWARVDFATPSVRKLIWEDTNSEDTVFSSIESTPIVRHRSFFPAINTVRDSGGLESLVGIGSRLKLTLVRNSRNDKALEKAFQTSVLNETVNYVEIALVSCEVLAYKYVSDDRSGHYVVVGEEYPVKFDRHDGYEEKAGDVIFYLKCVHGKARLVNRHNFKENGRPCSLELCNGKLTGCNMRSFPVEDVVCIEKAADPVDDYVPNKGRLEDGTKYFVYRLLFYTDGFNAHRSRLGSMDGMYMMPLGLPIDRRTEAGCLHKICLAPPGVSATDIMDVVVKDIIEGMTNGIEVDDDGEKALIFPDVICYTGDSPALASVTGTKGHSSDCPCHACSFRKDKKKILSIVSNNGVSTSTCFAKRTHTKIRDIERQKGNDADTLAGIGVSNSNAPLMKLSDEVEKLRNIPRTSEGKQVVPNCFDAYRFALISPDHVFLGLISNALELFLKLLKRSDRQNFDVKVTAILRRNGMYGRTTILNSEKNLMKTTISEAFAILFTAPIAINCCKFDIGDEKKKALKTSIVLIEQLSDIVVKSQSHPTEGVDSKKDLKSFNNSNGRTRLYGLVSDVRAHCEKIEEFSKIDPSNVRIIDKPNMHRFVELFVHTLPMFGSLRFIEELILEKAHQSAKKAIDMSNMKNEQLQAMADYLFDDFVNRLKSVTRSVGTQTEDDIREDVEKLMGRSNTLSVDSLTDPSVLSVVRLLGKDICHRNKPEEWRVEQRSEITHKDETEKTLDQAKKFLEKALSLLEKRDGWTNGWSCSQAFSATLLKPVGEMDELRKVSRVNRFEVLEFHCREGSDNRSFSFRRAELDGERRFLVVIGFLGTVQDGAKVHYAVGYFMDVANGERTCDEVDEIVYARSKCCVVLLELSRSVRKAFFCHACWLNAEQSPIERNNCAKSCSFLMNPSLITKEGKWVLKGRNEGFPPRSG